MPSQMQRVPADWNRCSSLERTRRRTRKETRTKDKLYEADSVKESAED